MPTLLDGNTNAPIMVIEEKAAELLLNEWAISATKVA